MKTTNETKVFFHPLEKHKRQPIFKAIKVSPAAILETTQECFSKDASVTDGSSEEEASATVEFVRIPTAGQENSAVNTRTGTQ